MVIFFRPRKDSKTAMVAVVNETSEAKSQSAFERPEMKVSGFFDNDWSTKTLEFLNYKISYTANSLIKKTLQARN